MHTQTYLYLSVYVYMYVCVCVCIKNEGDGCLKSWTNKYIFANIYILSLSHLYDVSEYGVYVFVTKSNPHFGRLRPKSLRGAKRRAVSPSTGGVKRLRLFALIQRRPQFRNPDPPPSLINRPPLLPPASFGSLVGRSFREEREREKKTRAKARLQSSNQHQPRRYDITNGITSLSVSGLRWSRLVLVCRSVDSFSAFSPGFFCRSFDGYGGPGELRE